MISKKEFNARVAENNATFAKDYKNNTFDVSKYHMAGVDKSDLSVPFLLGKVHDIYAAAATGTLAIYSKTGADAIKLVNGKFVDVELKTSYIHSSKIWQTKNETLYTGAINLSGRRVGVTSAIQASYSIHNNNNIKNKDMLTYLISLDATAGKIIDIHSLSGKALIDLISTNSNTGMSKQSTKRQVKLCSFLKYGTQHKSDVPVIGLDKWKSMLVETVPVLEPGELFD